MYPLYLSLNLTHLSFIFAPTHESFSYTFLLSTFNCIDVYCNFFRTYGLATYIRICIINLRMHYVNRASIWRSRARWQASITHALRMHLSIPASASPSIAFAMFSTWPWNLASSGKLAHTQRRTWKGCALKETSWMPCKINNALIHRARLLLIWYQSSEQFNLTITKGLHLHTQPNIT